MIDYLTETCGRCQHCQPMLSPPPQKPLSLLEPLPLSHECRESIKLIVLPTGGGYDLEVKTLYAAVAWDFPACSHFAAKQNITLGEPANA